MSAGPSAIFVDGSHSALFWALVNVRISMARRRNDDRPIGCVLIEGPLADIARRAPGGFCAALTSFGSAVTEECWFSNYFSVSLDSIVEKCKISIAFATSLGSDEICRLSW